MANKKISELTSAVTPLTGSEEVAIVQNGETVKTAVSNLGGGDAPYLKYVALLEPNPNFDNNNLVWLDPIAIVLENTLGSDIIWTRQGEGYYKGENINFSNPNKIFLNFTANYSHEGSGNIYTASGEIYDDSSGYALWFQTRNSDLLLEDAWGTFIPIEIRIYP